jgi:hypothetical protein
MTHGDGNTATLKRLVEKADGLIVSHTDIQAMFSVSGP